ncbi:MAG: heavy metal sensor histidine kinase, partial [Gammaproteobacteria bacterium]
SWRRLYPGAAARLMPGKPRSIAFRLTALYALCTLLVLVVCGAVLYAFLIHSFEAEDGEFLAAKVHELRADFANAGNNAPMFVKKIEAAQANGRFREYDARIVSADGGVLGETAGMRTQLPRKLFPAVQSRAEFAAHPHWVEVKHGKAYLVAATVLGRDAATGSMVSVEVAVDVSRDEGVLADYRNTLLLVLFFGTLLAAALGAWVARRGLLPLRAITHAMEKVTAEQMGYRIDVPGRWPRELGRLARAFDDMLERLDRAFRGLRRFSADVAHELRTPLNNLRGEGEVALAQPRNAEEYREVIESMLEEQARMGRIVASLLFLARAEQRRERVTQKDLDLRPVADAMVEYYRPLTEEKGVSLVCTGAGRAFADPDLLQRAIGNLLSNAIEHTPRGGSIRVEIEESATQGAKVRVIDSGCGIAEEHLPHLCERFYRADAARTGGAQGSGLGLSLVSSIMELHGGSVHIASAVGTGTTVTLSVPRAIPV